MQCCSPRARPARRGRGGAAPVHVAGKATTAEAEGQSTIASATVKWAYAHAIDEEWVLQEGGEEEEGPFPLPSV